MMKNLILLLSITSLVAAGCAKHQSNEVHATITNLQTYDYDFGICGDEEGVTIDVAAKHAEQCKIIRDSTTFFCCRLRYKAEAGYVGPDVVEVITNTGSNGASSGTLEQITFYFTITD